MRFAGRVEAQITIPTGGAAVSATNSGGGPTTVTVPAGTYYLSALCAALQAALTTTRAPSSGSWSVTASTTGLTATGQVTINCTGTWSLVWTSTDLRDALGFTATITSVTTAQTGAKQSTMVWFPECPLVLDGDTQRAPVQVDIVETQTPTGRVYATVGTAWRQHANAKWAMVPTSRAWEANAALANASWETFVKNTQVRQGASSWWKPRSLVQVYDHNGTQLGGDASLPGFQMLGVAGTSLVKPIANFTGLWTVMIPTLLAEG